MHAFLFPGQGAQAIGMGKDLAENFLVAKNVFEEVNDALNQDLSALIWDGDIETLTLTENAQPALMATSIAAIKALESEGIEFGQASYIAGHSLGEYSALCAAGSLSLMDTAKLLRIRGKAMQDAVPFGVGAMAAILGLDFETVSQITNSSANDQVCQAANDNDPGQVVISGHKNAVEETIELAKDAGAKRAILLPVSAPFHCSLMQPAADTMAKALSEIILKDPIVPLVANVKANKEVNGETIKDLLVEQVTGSVRWRESIEFMSSEGVSEVYEIGAGKALSGMVRRIDREINVNQVFDTSSVRAAVLKLK
ncbi:MAG: ACP S-malonyltransferase [Rhodobacterales bacterium]|jgi:[acyl-carrier-protein] S-malonyltransferase|nr:ACP S-malonyltransferase [Rhodobacterales bacterium]MBT7559031.1 ACP S-malonyltransferase [Rhodobacterales bacterium]MDA9308176.1 ACP S-malonyltransferase [Amylibacter sp.]MDG1496361.1 ACP S-malonyltransferase [Amylibacter sp.]|tara:strand:- start:1564 stop:2499 length:936 start_codon:yes stop_codon:yes gene_type:complete